MCRVSRIWAETDNEEHLSVCCCGTYLSDKAIKIFKISVVVTFVTLFVIGIIMCVAAPSVKDGVFIAGISITILTAVSSIGTCCWYAYLYKNSDNVLIV